MTNLKHISKLHALSLIIMLGLFSTGIINQLFANTPVITNNYSGEELVRGIFLADGVVAEQLPGLKEFSSANFTSDGETKRAINDFNDQVIDQIKRDQPSFFNDFREQVYSRNHATIRSAIESGKGVVLSSMDKVNRQSSYEMDAETVALSAEIKTAMESTSSPSEAAAIARAYLDSQSAGQRVTSVQAIAVETASIAIATRVAVAFYTEYFFWPENIQNSPSNNRIFQETIIDAIATKL